MAKFRWAILAFNLFFVIGLFFLIQTRNTNSAKNSLTELPFYGTVPVFTLTERSGASVSLSDLNNKVWVADFIFTRCAGQCPRMNQKVMALQEKLKQTTFVSFSVDPETDTPKVLADYAKVYNADPVRWLFLTGDKDVLNQVAQGFHLTSLGDPMFHSVRFMLVDKQGTIRGYYDSEDADQLKALIRDAKTLSK